MACSSHGSVGVSSSNPNPLLTGSRSSTSMLVSRPSLSAWPVASCILWSIRPCCTCSFFLFIFFSFYHVFLSLNVVQFLPWANCYCSKLNNTRVEPLMSEQKFGRRSEWNDTTLSLHARTRSSNLCSAAKLSLWTENRRGCQAMIMIALLPFFSCAYKLQQREFSSLFSCPAHHFFFAVTVALICLKLGALMPNPQSEWCCSYSNPVSRL